MRSPPPPLAWPYPRYSHYIMARARSSHRSPAAPRALYTPADTRTPPPRSPPKSHPGDLSFGQRSAGTGPRSGCEPPPPPPPPPATPASSGPHAASHLASFPSPRVGETLPAAASPPDPAVNSGHRHPRTSRRATVTLPVPSVRRRRGSERGRGAGRAAVNPPGGGHA